MVEFCTQLYYLDPPLLLYVIPFRFHYKIDYVIEENVFFILIRELTLVETFYLELFAIYLYQHHQ